MRRSLPEIEPMSDYWHRGYLQALAKLGGAQSLQARVVYYDLAAHYDAMRHFCERHTLGHEIRSAA
jgi:hypothetical protein